MSFSTCALCPRLCRSACPVATGSGREAAVPAVIAGVVLAVERGDLPEAMAREAVTLCTDCGACQEHCHLHVPLPELLRRARIERVARPPLEPLAPVEGTGEIIAVESDERPFAEALAAVSGVPVRRWRTRDSLGVDSRHHRGFDERLERIRSAVGRCEVVLVDGGAAQVLEMAGVRFQWLHERFRDLDGGDGSCVLGGTRPLECCGGAGPLRLHHPEDARRVGRLWLERAAEWRVRDARCRRHLNGCGDGVADPLDALLERAGMA